VLVLLHLFSLFLLVFLGFYVFVADPRSRANQTFAAFIAFLALWTTKDLIFWNFPSGDANAGWWAASSFVIALLMQFALVVFAWVFPENARTPRKKAAVLFAPAIILIPAAFFGVLWRKASVDSGRFVIDLAPLAYFFVAYVYFVFAYGAAVLYRKYRRHKESQRGQQVVAIIWGLLITVVLITIVNIILPFLDSFYLLPFSSLFVLPGVLIYAYAIANFKLFSLQTALHQFRLFGITYKVAISIALVAIISFAMFQIPIVWWAFRDGMDFEAWRKYLVFSIISALVPNLLLVLLVLRIISRPLQKITLAAVKVTEGEYGTEVDLRKTNDEIGLLADSFNDMSRRMAADIEQLREMNEQLMRADRLAAMGTLAAGVAHEVNNPLASISSLIQMMRAGNGSEADRSERLDLISDQIERITRVTKDLTDFARSRPAAKIMVHIDQVIDSALRLASFDKTFQSLQINVDYDRSIPQVFADGDQLQQVFLNLFLNARDAMPDGGELRVTTARSGSNVTIEIADSGTGISEGSGKHIFDPFYTTKPAGKGTGLGLAVCYGIITAHGGSIDIDSERKSGAAFTIRLPLDKEQTKEAGL
jgi:signal transduction histidine kinase